MTTESTPAYEVSKHEGYSVLKFNGTPSKESGVVFAESVAAFIVDHPGDVLINCEGLTQLPVPWVRALIMLHGGLKPSLKQIRLVGTSEVLMRFLKTEGLHTSLRAFNSTREALVELGHLKQRSLDVNFVNPFLNAAITVLKIQASTEAKAGQIYKRDARERFLGDISGVIGLVSDAFTGSVVISFPAPTFLGIMSRMLGEEYKEINKEIEDGAGELTNIIFGQAKTALNERGYGIKTALPSVITGQQHSVLQMSNGPRVVIPFETDVGPFFVEISTSA